MGPPRLVLACLLAVAQGTAQAPDGERAAEDGRHWSYRQVRRPGLPEGAEVSPIDAFVAAALRREGLEPAAPADRATWLRRVSLDLTGLPPAPAEVDAFVADQGDDAFERAVDRLLASKRYGERRAQTWLDLARYADSQGYEKDDLRPTVWRWRDWVIDAFNRDLPFDRFTIEQMAGDLLPDATVEERLATAFHRHAMTNTEGGTDDEEFRCAAVVDRVNTTMSVWMGSTFGCTQCHDHKFDPFTQREYYALFAFFDQTADRDQPDESPTMPAPTAAEAARARELEALLTGSSSGLRGRDAEVAAWADAQRQRLAAHAAARPECSPWQLGGPFAAADFHAAYATAFAPETGAAAAPAVSWVERPDFEDGKVHTWKGDNSAFYLRRTIRAAAAGPAVLSLGSDDAIKVFWNGREILAKEVSRGAAKDQEILEVGLLPGDNELLLKVVNGAGPGGFFFDLRQSALPTDVVAVLAVDPATCSPAQAEALAASFAAHAPELAEVRARVAALEQELAAVAGPGVPVLRELPGDQRRTTRIHLRGSFLTQGDAVQPDTPRCLHPFPADAPRNRLGLAHWLVAADNPLCARVQVNRLWEELFGRGLVETIDDFGVQGERPSHPELLDWLAAEFQQNGWSVKRLLRTIVLSATYRRSSAASRQQIERDPHNRWYARGPQLRLPAETLRDQALAVSGLLSGRIGGPSVMPPQPDGIWLQMYSGARWQTSTGEDRYRRGLYTFWRRTSPHPAMLTFDAPSREFCVARRSRTNTPLQALVTWNDPQFFECAQGLAVRTLAEAALDPWQRIEHMFRVCLSRSPSPAERDRLVQLWATELQVFRKDPARAQQVTAPSAGGSSPVPEGVLAADLAAWTVVASVLLNLDEFVTKG